MRCYSIISLMTKHEGINTFPQLLFNDKSTLLRQLHWLADTLPEGLNLQAMFIISSACLLKHLCSREREGKGERVRRGGSSYKITSFTAVWRAFRNWYHQMMWCFNFTWDWEREREGRRRDDLRKQEISLAGSKHWMGCQFMLWWSTSWATVLIRERESHTMYTEHTSFLTNIGCMYIL